MPYSFPSMTNPFVGLPLGRGVLNRASQLPKGPTFTPYQRQIPQPLPGTPTAQPTPTAAPVVPPGRGTDGAPVAGGVAGPLPTAPPLPTSSPFAAEIPLAVPSAAPAAPNAAPPAMTPEQLALLSPFIGINGFQPWMLANPNLLNLAPQASQSFGASDNPSSAGAPGAGGSTSGD